MKRESIKGQSTAEYAIVFAIVLAAVVGMQTLVKRAYQGRIKSGTDLIGKVTKGDIGTTGTTLAGMTQYEPYYAHSDFKSFSAQKSLESQTTAPAAGAAATPHKTARRTIRTKNLTDVVQGEKGADTFANDDAAWATKFPVQ